MVTKRAGSPGFLINEDVGRGCWLSLRDKREPYSSASPWSKTESWSSKRRSVSTTSASSMTPPSCWTTSPSRMSTSFMGLMRLSWSRGSSPGVPAGPVVLSMVAAISAAKAAFWAFCLCCSSCCLCVFMCAFRLLILKKTLKMKQKQHVKGGRWEFSEIWASWRE